MYNLAIEMLLFKSYTIVTQYHSLNSENDIFKTNFADTCVLMFCLGNVLKHAHERIVIVLRHRRVTDYNRSCDYSIVPSIIKTTGLATLATKQPSNELYRKLHVGLHVCTAPVKQ